MEQFCKKNTGTKDNVEKRHLEIMTLLVIRITLLWFSKEKKTQRVIKKYEPMLLHCLNRHHVITAIPFSLPVAYLTKMLT